MEYSLYKYYLSSILTAMSILYTKNFSFKSIKNIFLFIYLSTLHLYLSKRLQCLHLYSIKFRIHTLEYNLWVSSWLFECSLYKHFNQIIFNFYWISISFLFDRLSIEAVFNSFSMPNLKFPTNDYNFNK